MNRIYLFPSGLLIVLIASISIFSCSTKTESFNPQDVLSKQEADANLWSIIRYIGRTPEEASGDDKFKPQYDSAYMEQMQLFSVDAWYKDGNTDYFLISRRAPSLTNKFVATGGKIVYDQNGGIDEYEEVFRTWKMVTDTLKKRSMLLFGKMVKGESLKEFETRYSNGIEFIEFPDERTYYDKELREWKVKGN